MTRHETLATLARRALQDSRGMGFDHLEINTKTVSYLGLRLALGTICRENVGLDMDSFSVRGFWNNRASSFQVPATSLDDLLGRIRALRENLALQQEDKECVVPQPVPGRFVWEIAPKPFAELYNPELIYRTLETHLIPVRARGLRASGFVEANEKRADLITSSGFELSTLDNGISIKITIDNPQGQGTGSGERASTFADKDELDRLVGECFADALQICTTGENAATPEPGDHTVVFSPAAVRHMLQTALGYGLWDRRKIDEERTYLSKHRDTLSFPRELALRQTPSLALGDGTHYCDHPFSHRGITCAPNEFIRDGHIGDTTVSAFWAKKTGLAETFSPHDGVGIELAIPGASPLVAGHKTLADLIATTKNGIYVAEVWYLRVVAEMEGTFTGMTRDGVFEIRDGKITRPLKNMRWHENPLRFLANITGATSQRTLFGKSRCSGSGDLALVPALRSEGFHFSSVTLF